MSSSSQQDCLAEIRQKIKTDDERIHILRIKHESLNTLIQKIKKVCESTDPLHVPYKADNTKILMDLLKIRATILVDIILMESSQETLFEKFPKSLFL